MAADMDEFWVFGYGSLMWNPGFRFEEKLTARAFGYRRSLCVRSWVHRGTERHPGLVLGLDYGGSCIGTAFRVAPAQKAEVIDYLRERELVTHVYKERTMPVQLSSGHRVPALTYVIDRSHVQYAGALSAEEAAATVAVATGKSGPNSEYVLNTLEHLREMGIRDHWLEEVAAKLTAGGAESLRA
ncbi:gamma-glutamylcyclotransferase [Sinorhizobium meliloti]|jgi:cation transport protein ChaC|uniref:gamma-glutamylcyclotransferase n=1 Tax=Rhizobium meliloti TaxID=382 RepID=UPI000D1FBC3A|nr:gamma-glutamylcyclotransferase [Sinorhizobium meliloti]MDW9416192.1 gamma-glutamylcyclotransferase [Sinorhizobium meliloti]MDW9479771.1 gamma-glutamylcyclotransferase [Sinorhizobium meliloti]MDW9512783.1 gamma-glutamylcyclotransferase [Sinorhizobium meliloti]MDW9593604.1 gamma-glutamylcyclotransferase [Sinorhizobium meliloti]MDW9638455.1 gamma-glutamylcyclotransferase [Sinorhizobium meliloti]